jgi:hypothetical protein
VHVPPGAPAVQTKQGSETKQLVAVEATQFNAAAVALETKPVLQAPGTTWHWARPAVVVQSKQFGSEQAVHPGAVT